MNIRGVVPPMTTLLDENRRIDFGANQKLIDFLIDSGVNGILILGTCGEFFAFTEQERREFVTFAVKAVNHRVPLLVGTGHTDEREAARFTKFVGEAGADGALVVSPYYVALDDNALYHYYYTVSHASDTPVLFYNFPDRTGISLNTPLVKRILKDCPTIVGVKDTINDYGHTRTFLTDIRPDYPGFITFTGWDEYFLLNLLNGGNGIIGAYSNFTPSLYAKLYQAYQTGDMDLAAECQKKIGILMGLSSVSAQSIAVVKYAVSLVLGVCDMPAAPFEPLSSVQKEQVRTILTQAGIFPAE